MSLCYWKFVTLHSILTCIAKSVSFRNLTKEETRSNDGCSQQCVCVRFGKTHKQYTERISESLRCVCVCVCVAVFIIFFCLIHLRQAEVVIICWPKEIRFFRTERITMATLSDVCDMLDTYGGRDKVMIFNNICWMYEMYNEYEESLMNN